MIIIGVEFPPRVSANRNGGHGDGIVSRSAQVRVGMEASGHGRWFERMLRRGRKIAKIAMARRLAVCLYWMLRQGWDYQQWIEFGSHAGQPGNRHGVQ